MVVFDGLLYFHGHMHKIRVILYIKHVKQSLKMPKYTLKQVKQSLKMPKDTLKQVKQ